MSDTSVDEQNSSEPEGLIGDKDNGEKKKLSTRDAYFSALDLWVNQSGHMLQAQSLFPFYFYATINQQMQQSNSAPQTQTINTENRVDHNDNAYNVGFFRILDEASQADIIRTNGGYEYVIASFWKRAIAETIDGVLLLILKLIVIFNIFDVLNFDWGFDSEKEAGHKKIDDSDLTLTNGFAILVDILSVSSAWAAWDVITKLVICLYDAVWITLYGATPGKKIMKLQILYVEAVLPLQPQLQAPAPIQIQLNHEPVRALISPARLPGFRRAFMRSGAKNFLMTLMFPMFFVMIFFKNNRTAYDVVTKTIVVERNTIPTFRRPEPQQHR